MIQKQSDSMTHLHHLSVEIGPRPVGSPGNHQAAEYIRQAFQDLSLEVEMQTFDCPAWEHTGTSLAFAGESHPAYANAFSPACFVQAEPVPVATVAELEGAALEGRIAVLYGDLTLAPLSPKDWFLRSEREDHIIRLLEEKRPAALLTVQTRPGEIQGLIEDAAFTIPSATIPADVGLKLLRQDRPLVQLRIEARASTSSTCNVIARREGRGRRRLVMCAHYDTKFDTPGACDNAAGVAGMLTLVQRLVQRDPVLGLEAIAFTGEEYLPLGEDTYLPAYEGRLNDILALVNLDGIGYALGATSITALAVSQPFQDLAAGFAKGYPGVVWAEPWVESNHSLFAMRGVPCLALTSQIGRHHNHLRTDTIDRIGPHKIEEAVALVAEIAAGLEDKSLDWTRPA